MIEKTTAILYAPRKAGNKIIQLLGQEVSHRQAACGSILAHQASNYDLLNFALGSGIHIKNNLNCRFWPGLFKICQEKEETFYKNKTTEDRNNSFQAWIQADPTSLALFHISVKMENLLTFALRKGKLCIRMLVEQNKKLVSELFLRLQKPKL